MKDWGARLWHVLLLKTCKHIQYVMLIVCVLGSLLPGAYAVTATEGKLRAAVIVGIMRFTSWPNSPVITSASQLNVCLVGEPTSQEFLMPISGQRKVAGKDLVVKEVANLDISQCQVLVLGESLSRKSLKKLLKKADTDAMLSVCDGCSADLAEEPIINLTLRQQKVKFKVNLIRAKETGVSLDAQLLELALAVRK